MFKAITSTLAALLVLLSFSVATLAELPDNPIIVPNSNLPDGPGTRGGTYLERLTKPQDIVPNNQSAPQIHEGLMNINSSFISHLQAPVAVQPGQRPLHYPAMSAQPL